MGQIRHDHVGITVTDLDAVAEFFVALGLEVEGRMHLEGDFLDTVIGAAGARTEIMTLSVPGGGTSLELSSFVRPEAVAGSTDAPFHELGLRSLAFEVDDVAGLVAALAADGYGLVGGVGDYEGVWRMASVRGPEGLIVSLAQRLG